MLNNGGYYTAAAFYFGKGEAVVLASLLTSNDDRGGCALGGLRQDVAVAVRRRRGDGARRVEARRVESCPRDACSIRGRGSEGSSPATPLIVTHRLDVLSQS